jgi:2-dehydropantoate 2-reductase
MKIAIFGAGGVGGYFGARLAQAGEDVRFVARGRHLAALRETGLRIESALGDALVKPVAASDDPATLGPVDLVLVAVKLYDTEAAAAGCKALLGPDGAVVSLQNGVTAAETLGRRVGRERVMGGVTYIMATIDEPGAIAHLGTMAQVVFGEFGGARTPRLEALLAACRAAGIDAVLSPDIAVDIWTKFAFLAPLSGVTALMRAPIGRIRADADTRRLYDAALDEVVAVARAKGIGLAPDILERHAAKMEGLPADMGSSMLHDLTHGKRLELPWLSGTVARLGRELGVATPTHDFIAAALKLHVTGSAQS